MIPLPAKLLQQARAAPGRAAIIDGERVLTYAELVDQASRLAAFLRSKNMAAGSRVLLCMDNSAEYVVALYGCWLSSLVACPVNAQAPARELIKVVGHAECALVIADANNRQVRASLADLDCPVLMAPRGRASAADGCWDWSAAVSGQETLAAAAGDTDPAMILYTSGTTGHPKGILLTHRNLSANVASIVQYLALDENDCVLNVLPFHYSYGNSVLNTHLAAGGAVVIGPPMAYPQQVAEALRDRRITGFSGVPSTFAMLLHKTDWPGNPGHLRYVTQAGGAMGVEMTRQVLEALEESTRLFVMYGQTEATARLSYLPPERLEDKLGSAGLAIPGVQLRVVDEQGAVLPAGERGNVQARGDNVMAGYWKDADGSAAVLRDGWLHTGDNGWLDEEGFLFLDGRSSEMIKTGGHRVNPEEIEEVACEVPGVAEAGAVGVSDELLGQVIHLHVAGKADEETRLALQKALRSQLAPQKQPREIIWRESIPRTSSGKIQRYKLEEK